MCAQRRLRSAWASAQSDQSSLSTWRKLGSLATHWADSEASDQTGWMPRLIWVFAGRTCHFVCFVMRQLMIGCDYCKTPKYSDTRKIYSNNPKIWLIWIFYREMHPNDADGMANSVDPEQRSSLIWVYTVCSDLSVRKFRNITVHKF